MLEVADGRVLRVQVQLDRERVARRDELDVTATVRVGRLRRRRCSRLVHVVEQAQSVVRVRVRLVDGRSVQRPKAPVRRLLRLPYHQFVAFAVPAVGVLLDWSSVVMVLQS